MFQMAPPVELLVLKTINITALEVYYLKNFPNINHCYLLKLKIMILFGSLKSDTLRCYRACCHVVFSSLLLRSSLVELILPFPLPFIAELQDHVARCNLIGQKVAGLLACRGSLSNSPSDWS